MSEGSFHRKLILSQKIKSFSLKHSNLFLARFWYLVTISLPRTILKATLTAAKTANTAKRRNSKRKIWSFNRCAGDYCRRITRTIRNSATAPSTPAPKESRKSRHFAFHFRKADDASFWAMGKKIFSEVIISHNNFSAFLDFTNGNEDQKRNSLTWFIFLRTNRSNGIIRKRKTVAKNGRVVAFWLWPVFSKLIAR